mmetsp:Transcript_4000/g.2963  ORF Transcript_4000/g.2963 Transcript_4000/m.2963 type:complete len:127 (-) Transcript_4000:561-941(-)
MAEHFKKSTLVMLEEMNGAFPTLLLFHIKNLYLRFNLCQDMLSHFRIYHALNNQLTHDLFDHFLQAKIPIESMLPYIKGLESPSQRLSLFHLLLPTHLPNSAQNSFSRGLAACDYLFSEPDYPQAK